MTDENTLTMPDEWRRVLHPRRDRPDVPAAPATDPAAADRLRSRVADARDGIARILDHARTERGLADAARAHLRGDADPLGAAAVASAVTWLHRLHGRGKERLFTDAWVADHGAAFAAAAFTAFVGLESDGEAVWTMLGRNTELAWKIERETVRLLRAHLAAAPDDEYAQAVGLLAERRGDELQQLLAAYLVPTRADWVAEVCTDPAHAARESKLSRWLLFCALGRAHRPAALGLHLNRHSRDLDVLVSLVDGVGFESLLPLLVEAADDKDVLAEHLRAIAGVLAALPSDDAFRALFARMGLPPVRPAAVDAAHRFPARAMRLLPESDAPHAADLLAVHIRAHPDLAESTRVPDAADLPPVLTDPPWTRPQQKAGPVVLKDLPLPGVRVIVWRPGEREEWASRTPSMWTPDDDVDFDEVAADFDRATGDQQIVFMVAGPGDAARPLLAGWHPEGTWEPDDWAPPLVGRFGLDAHDAVLSAARGYYDPVAASESLLPLRSDEIARTMAGRLRRTKDAQWTARTWFDRHGVAAAPSLLPDALGKAGAARRAAEAALRLLADRHGPEPVVEAARVHGDEAAAAIESMLSADPADDLPKKIPSIEWADPRLLPQLLLRDRTCALPDGAVRHVLTMLAMSTPDAPYAGVRTVREICDPASLAEFGWALFRWWELCGAPSKDGWALIQLGLTGDDGTVRRLAPVIRAWPGEGGHARAVTGLDVLAAIGTGTALMHLHSISQRVKFKGLKAKAQEKIQEVAAGLELTSEQLADRLVPDLGLDASGTLVLDYGPRRFTIGFDEHLKPTIADEDGKPRKSLPKPGAKDDPDVAPAAAKQFATLKKEARAVASDQLVRLEKAMVARRRWPLAEFHEFLAGHSLLRHLVRRLVWLVEDGPAFRVAEDSTCTDADDETITLPESARIGIAHPLDLPDGLSAWGELFADYEILQPFPQLGRQVHTLTDDERTSGRLARFENLKVPVGDVLGLAKRGWERGTPMDAGVVDWISRRLGPDRYMVVTLDPGIDVEEPGLLGDQTLEDVRLAEHPGWYGRHDVPTLRLGDLDPVTASEVLADLTHLTREANR